LARGASRSDEIDKVLIQAREIAAAGIKEIVLTGVNIGDFGKKGEYDFFDLVKALEGVEDIDRIRISSIEPNLLSNEIIEFVAQSKKFVPHFHIPLQSGNNKILAAMRRRYKRELYADRVKHIKKFMPNACIGVDVIVGFPGESREDFIDTYNFINDMDISYLHVFTYSERKDTLAAEMKSKVPGSERSERNQMLHILSDKKRRHFYESQLNTHQTVLFEADQKEGWMHGFTRNYVKVKAQYDPLLVNTLYDVQLKEIDEDGDVLIEEVNEILVHSS
jgi:threonylcarbamoyladenosine tRNA methylthiotransferase MtaB